MLGHWNYLLIDSKREDHNKILMYFHVLFVLFLYGEILAQWDSKVLGLSSTDGLGWNSKREHLNPTVLISPYEK